MKDMERYAKARADIYKASAKLHKTDPFSNPKTIISNATQIVKTQMPKRPPSKIKPPNNYLQYCSEFQISSPLLLTGSTNLNSYIDKPTPSHRSTGNYNYQESTPISQFVTSPNDGAHNIREHPTSSSVSHQRTTSSSSVSHVAKTTSACPNESTRAQPNESTTANPNESATAQSNESTIQSSEPTTTPAAESSTRQCEPAKQKKRGRPKIILDTAAKENIPPNSPSKPQKKSSTATIVHDVHKAPLPPSSSGRKRVTSCMLTNCTK